MSLIQQIRDDRAAFGHDKFSKNTLTTLIGEIQRSQKSPSIEPTDEEVLSKIKALIKSVDFTINARLEQGLPVEEQLAEKKIYQKYQPSQMSDEELDQAINSIIVELNATTMKDCSKVMGALNQKFKAQFDGAKASSVVRNKLK